MYPSIAREDNFIYRSCIAMFCLGSRVVIQIIRLIAPLQKAYSVVHKHSQRCGGIDWLYRRTLQFWVAAFKNAINVFLCRYLCLVVMRLGVSAGETDSLRLRRIEGERVTEPMYWSCEESLVGSHTFLTQTAWSLLQKTRICYNGLISQWHDIYLIPGR